MIVLPKLGIIIRPDTPKEEIARLRAKYPEVERAIAKREQRLNIKKDSE